jgi:hypothetical protein
MGDRLSGTSPADNQPGHAGRQADPDDQERVDVVNG